MKRLAIILAALILGAALCACNDDSEKKNESSASSKTDSSASETESSKSDASKTESSDSNEDSKTESSESGEDSKTESSESGEDSKAESSASSKSKKNKHTLEDYVEQVKKGGLSENDTMDIDVYAENDTFVYSFKYKTQIEEDKLSGVQESLLESLESSADTYTGVIDEISDYTGLNAKVRVIYKNADDTIIAEKTYTK